MIYFVAVGLLILLVTFSTSIVSLSICHYRYCLLKKVIPTLEADADYNLKSHPENMRDFRILFVSYILYNFAKRSINSKSSLQIGTFRKWCDTSYKLFHQILFFPQV